MSATARLAVAATAGMLGLVMLAPPAAAADPMVEWTRPTPNEVIEDPGFATGDIPVTGTITGDEGQTIDDIDVALIAEEPLDDPCVIEEPPTSVLGQTNSEDFSLDIAFPCNGVYELTATIGYTEPSLDRLGVEVGRNRKESSSLPIDFSVAIPPARVEAFGATYDEATKEVRLNWARNAEADLIGYYVERNAPGPEGFTRITPDPLPPDQTSFTDPAIEDEHRYQVVAVRAGSRPDSQIPGETSPVQTAGPERTEPTLPDDLPAPNSRPPAASGGSGSSGGNTRRAAPAPSQTRTTSNIFEETLPFDPSQTTLPPPSDSPGDAAVLAEFDDESTDDDRRATLVPVAGGLALVIGAMHLFLLSKRAGEPEDIPMSRT